jgi:hypothetical protein
METTAVAEQDQPLIWDRDNRARLFHILPSYMDSKKIPAKKIWLTAFLFLESWALLIMFLIS